MTLALLVAALVVPATSGARAATAAARVKQCRHRYAGKGKKRLQAKHRCIRKARAGHRSEPASPVKRPSKAPSTTPSGSPQATGSSSSPGPQPEGGDLPAPPNPPPPEAPSPLEVDAPDASVAVGSAIDLPLPEPLTSLGAIESVTGAEPGVAVRIAGSGAEVSASADAATGSTELTIRTIGCTAAECGLPVALRLRISVTAMEAPAGNLESFTEPSPDRLAAVTEQQLPDEVLVMLGSDDAPGTRVEAEDAAAIVGAVVAGGMVEEGIYQLRWATPQDIAARITELERLPFVTAVTPSYVGTTEAQSAYTGVVGSAYDQPYWTWRYDKVDASQAWAQSTGSGITVGIIDEGNVLAGSPDLNVARTLDPIAIPAAHATHVAGLACGKAHGGGMVGLAWGCPIVTTAVERFPGEPLGALIPDANYMTAMQRMIKAPGVRVVNLSMGWPSGCATESERNKIEAWISHSKAFFRRFLGGPGSNIVWTFSAGNNCMYGPSSPWAASEDLPNVIAVAASNADGRLASFSNYGVGVAAPGGVEPSSPAIDLHASCDRDAVLDAGRCGLLSSTVEPCSTSYCPERGEMAGTSMASPIVAGIAALVASKHPAMSASQIGSCIKTTAGTGAVGSTGPPDGQPGGAYLDPPLDYIGAPIPIVNAAAAVECENDVPVVQVDPHGPTSGPAGFGMEVTVPTCTYLEVLFDGTAAYTLGAYSPSQIFDAEVPSTMSLGQHQMSFACHDEAWDGEPTWTSPGFQVTVTGAPTPIGLESTTAPAGGEFIFTSGPSLSTTQCPPLPNVNVYGLSIYLDSGIDGSLVTNRFVSLPDGRATEGLTVPPDTPPGDYLALDRCYYSNGAGEIGIYQFAWEWPDVTVTADSAPTATGLPDSTALRPHPASAAPLLAIPVPDGKGGIPLNGVSHRFALMLAPSKPDAPFPP